MRIGGLLAALAIIPLAVLGGCGGAAPVTTERPTVSTKGAAQEERTLQAIVDDLMAGELKLQPSGRVAECNALVEVINRGQDMNKAVTFYTRACDADHPSACNMLGYALALGKGDLKVDGVAAMKLFRKSCEAGLGSGCDSLGEAYEKGWGTTPSKTEAVKWYDKACKMGVKVGCMNAERLRAE